MARGRLGGEAGGRDGDASGPIADARTVFGGRRAQAEACRLLQMAEGI
jgi:hypothetical protein